jgi:hypothetical protein
MPVTVRAAGAASADRARVDPAVPTKQTNTSNATIEIKTAIAANKHFFILNPPFHTTVIEPRTINVYLIPYTSSITTTPSPGVSLR